MKLVVLAVGNRMPAWVDAAFAEYAGRMPREARMELVAVKAAPRGGATQRLLDGEGERILAAVPTVFLFRLATFWLPILPGWGAFQYLRKEDYL